MEKREQILKPFEEHSSYINSRVAAGVECYRKGTADLEVVDAKGQPIPHARVSVTLKNHEFLHGCNLFLLDEIDDSDKNETYKRLLAEGFNQATLPFYWSGIEPSKGAYRYTIDSPRIYRRPVPDLCIDFCQKHEIVPKAHCLNYYNAMPDWVPTEHYAFWKALEQRFESLAERYADQIHGWEVTNETLRFYATKNFRRGTSAFFDRDFVERSFALAEKYFPHNELIINEAHFNIWGDNFREDRSAYYMQIERALFKGARIDTIGLQFHMFVSQDSELEVTKPYYDPYTLFETMDRYSDFGKPLQITEITIPAYSDRPEDEEIQAELLKQLYRIWFSHPNMEMITYWNLIDGYAWSEDNIPGNMTSGENLYYGGLLRFDGTPKPAYQVLKDLFTKEWHTEADLITDENGRVSFRGFFGNYEAKVWDGKRNTTHTLQLSKTKEAPIRIIIG